MKNKHCLALAVVSTLTAFSTAAQEMTPSFYVGASLGAGKLTDMDSAVTNSTGVDRDTTVWGFYAGAQLEEYPWLAVELGYVDLGKVSLDDVPGDFKASGFDFAAKFIYDVDDQFNVFGRLGGIAYDWEANGVACCDDSDVSATYGVGVTMNFQNQWNGVLEYRYYNNIGGSPDFHTYNLGVQYAF
ncbi:outer membrane beta-barrel protein [Vibrio sp. WXL103]|uniref:outer membrane beta-barrel protein n=1 Tax=unclassified Vibrio TaxID=2614977 RepID=UPI003EC58D7C